MKKKSDLTNYAIGAGLYSLIDRYGNAGAEFLKGLRGIDAETGFQYDRSLMDIAGYKLNPQYLDRNIKQQAGFSAEIASCSKSNAQNIIDGKKTRAYRSEDVAGYGKNHNVIDILEITDGTVVSSQMKFVTDPDDLLKKIAKGEGGGKNDYSRYLQADKLDVPTEQVEVMIDICQKEAKNLSEQAKLARTRGDSVLAERLQKQADNYKELEGKISDSGLTTEEAIRYRLNPKWETTKDIASVSHQAGIQGAKFGAVIGGSISIITNSISVYSGDKEFGEAVIDTASETLVAAGVGYATAFSGTAIKTYMQQSSSVVTRQLSKTGLPGMVVSTCLSMGKSITRYAQGEIDESELLVDVGDVTAGMISGSMFTVLGQIAIPIPVLGGLIGGMVGYALTNTFYQGFVGALKNAKLSAERRAIIEMQCEAAKAVAKAYEIRINQFFDRKLIELDIESKALFAILDNPNISADEFCQGINKFAEVLGKKLNINSMAELDNVMLSEEILVI